MRKARIGVVYVRTSAVKSLNVSRTRKVEKLFTLNSLKIFFLLVADLETGAPPVTIRKEYVTSDSTASAQPRLADPGEALQGENEVMVLGIWDHW